VAQKIKKIVVSGIIFQIKHNSVAEYCQFNGQPQSEMQKPLAAKSRQNIKAIYVGGRFFIHPINKSTGPFTDTNKSTSAFTDTNKSTGAF
jgi:hypothetical protein